MACSPEESGSSGGTHSIDKKSSSSLDKLFVIHEEEQKREEKKSFHIKLRASTQVYMEESLPPAQPEHKPAHRAFSNIENQIKFKPKQTTENSSLNFNWVQPRPCDDILNDSQEEVKSSDALIAQKFFE